MHMGVPTDSQFHASLFHRCIDIVPFTLLLSSVGVGCSLQSFDYLTNGGANSTSANVGGATSSGGTGGISTAAGGQTNNPSDAGQGGSTPNSSSDGGASAAQTQGGASATTGGAAQTGGSPSGGGSAGPCPMYAGAGGSVVTPPSNSFESSTTGWATMAESSLPISLVSGTDACVGSSYLRCAGTGRTQNWDGPQVEMLQYLVEGHKYVVTLAARFAPQDPPAAPGTLNLTEVLACNDTSVSASFAQLQSNSQVLTNWVRLTGNLSTALAGCTSLRGIRIYVESDSTTATKSIDLDDFQLIDVTIPGTGTGGAPAAGGASGIGGVSASGGTTAGAGASGIGGVPIATGGATAATGGARTTGGAPAASGGAPVASGGAAAATGGAPSTGGATGTDRATDAGVDAF